MSGLKTVQLEWTLPFTFKFNFGKHYNSPLVDAKDAQGAFSSTPDFAGGSNTYINMPSLTISMDPNIGVPGLANRVIGGSLGTPPGVSQPLTYAATTTNMLLHGYGNAFAPNKRLSKVWKKILALVEKKDQKVPFVDLSAGDVLGLDTPTSTLTTLLGLIKATFTTVHAYVAPALLPAPHMSTVCTQGVYTPPLPWTLRRLISAWFASRSTNPIAINS